MPKRDVDDRRRFLLWCAAADPDLCVFDNAEWRRRAEALLREEIGPEKADTAMIAELVLRYPFAVYLHPVAASFHDAARRRRGDVFAAVSRALKRKPWRAFEKSKPAKDWRRVTAEMTRIAAAGKGASVRAAIESLTGAVPEVSRAAGRLSKGVTKAEKFYRAATARERIVGRVMECRLHAGRLHEIIAAGFVREGDPPKIENPPPLL